MEHHCLNVERLKTWRYLDGGAVLAGSVEVHFPLSDSIHCAFGGPSIATRRSTTSFMLGRRSTSSVKQSAISASTAAGHSSGTRTGRQLPRLLCSFVISSHRTTP